ncbi:MAG: dTDP-glucose 4,6-dehydratase [Pseudomonadota bacterium]|nr:dTDP-glucose 4,6-dehydratase [Pseudomonadota bacterium]
MTASLLITGGAGFIGSSFVAQCAARGCRVVVLDALTYAGHRENVDKHASLVVGDIADRDLVRRLLREHAIDAVINFAAESHVDNSIAGPKPFIDTNITGTFQLLEACREYWDGKPEFRFVQISTDEVYGSLGPTGKFSEASPVRPNSPYSASKAAADHLARAWHETYGLPVIVTHCTNNYGPRQHPEKLIPNMIRCALAGKKLPVYGDGKNVRDWIHVEDHCEGVWLALTKGTPGEVYDFGGDNEVENLTLVRQICTLLDQKRPKSSGSYADQIAFVTDRLGHDRRYAIDDSKSQRELGFTRRYKLEQGLERTVEWYLENEAWCNMIMGKR